MKKSRAFIKSPCLLFCKYCIFVPYMDKIIQKHLIFAVFLALLALGCSKHETITKLQPDTTEQNSEKIYRYFWGEKDGFKAWIVDGAEVRKEFFAEFIYSVKKKGP